MFLFFWHVEHVVPASMCAHKFCMTERLAKNKAEGRLRGLRSISESMYVQLRVATPPLMIKFLLLFHRGLVKWTFLTPVGCNDAEKQCKTAPCPNPTQLGNCLSQTVS